MSSYTKLVMIPMDMYNDIIGGASQQQEIVTPPPQIPMNPPPKNKKRYKKRKSYKKKTVRQLLSSMTKKQLMKITGGMRKLMNCISIQSSPHHYRVYKSSIEKRKKLLKI